MPTRLKPVGNLLGSPRAEADPLLDRAFVPTSDYHALTARTDFNFVVGRRGTGKSALFRKTAEHFQAEHSVLLCKYTPPEHATMEFQRLLERCETYRVMRAAARLCWRGRMLIEATDHVLSVWEKFFQEPHPFLLTYKESHLSLFSAESNSRHVEIFRHYSAAASAGVEIPDLLARGLLIEEFQKQVAGALDQLRTHVVLLFDGLDEGWEPTLVSAAALGGLAVALSDLADARTPLHGVVFVRDNMMRALAHFDNDFSRHIEGNTLRLHWDEPSLLHLIASRLRVAFEFDDENDMRVWNRFTQRDLRGRPGFTRCLERTLYRPRDILVLLNRAYVTAAREGRTEIILDDIHAASKNISLERLSDLLKEYEVVLPGLELFVELFRNRPAVSRLGSILDLFEEAIEASRSELAAKAKEFALLGSAGEIFRALHAVGFIGLSDKAENRFVFCHDGSLSTTDDWNSEREVVVHPCYWEALNIAEGTAPPEVVTTVTDEYTLVPPEKVKDVRTRSIGRVLGALAAVPHGKDGAREFEKWVLRVVQVLFQGNLVNFQAKPNPGSVSQRDIVATNMAARGFWRRVLDDYKSRQVIFEAKNYAEITNEDLRQVLSYTGKDYGKLAVIIYRSEQEGVSQTTKAWLREMYHHSERLILLMPTTILQRCLQKLRTVRKHDYTEKQMTKRLDAMVRNYVAIPSGRAKGE
jgi:hypothetical protein